MPLLLSVAFQQLYQMADSMIVGRFAETAQAGELALAAVGASYPITQLFVAVATGINIGTSVLVSQLFGAKRYLRMKTAISTALVTTTVVALLLTLFGASFTNGLMSAADKAKLDGVAEGANNYTHPEHHPATVITEDDNHQFVTKAQKEAIDNMPSIGFGREYPQEAAPNSLFFLIG